MDINQQLEYLNLSSDILTENDVIDTVVSDTKKLVSAKGIYSALLNLSNSVQNDSNEKIDSSIKSLSNEISTSYQKAGNYITGDILPELVTKEYIQKQGFIKKHQSLDNYYTKNATSSRIELNNQFDSLAISLQGKLPTYVFDSTISNYVKLSDIIAAGFISSHQSLSDYYKKSQTSSKIELKNAFKHVYSKDNTSSDIELFAEFKKYQPAGNYISSSQFDDYYKKSQTSSNIELEEKFSNYDDKRNIFSKSQILSILQNYPKLEEVYKKYETDFILRKYVKSDEISSTEDLSREFSKYQRKGDYLVQSDISSNKQLSVEFGKYQKKGDYVLSSQISSNEQLKHEFQKYTLLNTISSNAELSTAFNNCIDSDRLNYYALKASVSTTNELNDKFSDIDSSIKNIVKLSGDSDISGNIEIEESLTVDKNLSTDFDKVVNLNKRLLFVNTLEKLIDEDNYYADLTLKQYYITICKLCEKTNEAIIYYNLPIQLIDTTCVSENIIDILYDTINEINRINHLPLLPDNIEIRNLVVSINDNLDQLRNEISSENLAQSLSALSLKITDNKRYINYIKDIVNDIKFQIDSFYSKDQTSSAVELSDAFYACAKRKDTYNKVEITRFIEECAKKDSVSSDIELALEFSKHVSHNDLIDILDDYPLKNEISSNNQLSLEFYKKYNKNCTSSNIELSTEFAKYKNLSANVSSISDLSNEFKKYLTKEKIYDELKKCALSNAVSSKYEVKNEFKKYQLKGNYIKHGEISSNTQLAREFIKYAKLSNVQANYAKKSEISNFALSSDVSCIIGNFALKDEVSSANELQCKFDYIDNELTNKVKIYGDSSVSGNIEVLEKIKANYISSNFLITDFEQYVNNNPKFLISSLVPYVKDTSNIGKLFATLNYLKYDANLSTDLFDLTKVSIVSIYNLYNTLNQINDMVHFQKLTEQSQLSSYVVNINQLIDKLAKPISSFNLQQSLSGISQKLNVVNSKADYNYELLNSIYSDLYSSYSKDQTSSSYELYTEFSKFQKKGNYVTYPQLTSNYYDKEYIDSNYASLTSTNVIKSICNFTNTINAKCANIDTLNIDFAKLINHKANNCLSSYLLFLSGRPFIPELVNRINEIIIYCKLDIPKIKSIKNLKENMIVTINKICDITGESHLSQTSNYSEMLNKLNILITKLYVGSGLDLQSVLQSHQLRSIIFGKFLVFVGNQLSIISANTDLSVQKIFDITDELSDNFIDISSSLSSYTLTSDLYNISTDIYNNFEQINQELDEKLIANDLTDINISILNLDKRLLSSELCADVAYISSELSSIRDLLQSYALTSDVQDIRNSLTNYVSYQSINNKLALSSYDDLQLDNKYKKVGNYVSCQQDTIPFNFGKMLVSGYYEPDENGEIQEFKFYLLSAEYSNVTNNIIVEQTETDTEETETDTEETTEQTETDTEETETESL